MTTPLLQYLKIHLTKIFPPLPFPPNPSYQTDPKGGGNVACYGGGQPEWVWWRSAEGMWWGMIMVEGGGCRCRRDVMAEW